MHSVSVYTPKFYKASVTMTSIMTSSTTITCTYIERLILIILPIYLSLLDTALHTNANILTSYSLIHTLTPHGLTTATYVHNNNM